MNELDKIPSQAVNVDVVVSDDHCISDDRYNGLCHSPREIGENSFYGQKNGILGYWNIKR